MRGGEGMTGDRTPGSATPSTTDDGEHGHPNYTSFPARRFRADRSRRQDQTRCRVDLRSSLDPDPLPAFVRTEPGIRKPVTTRGLTAPAPSGMTCPLCKRPIRRTSSIRPLGMDGITTPDGAVRLFFVRIPTVAGHSLCRCTACAPND